MASNVLLIILVAVTFTFSTTTGRIVKKRQIYREQVLPHAGGKIPDTAFQTDRLFLNHLQKEGIAIPDGIVLQQRNPQVYPFLNKQSRTVYKVALSSDGRYIPNEGRYFYDSPPSVETTYLVPQIHDYPERPSSSIMPAYPVYRQLNIQNPLLNQPKLQSKLKHKKKSFLYLSPYSKTSALGSDKLKIIKPQTQTLKVLNDPLGILSNNHHFNSNYGHAHLFNEFDNLFNDFQLDNPRPIYKQ
ncbi:uncharacterized protein LOC129947059 [Eupeodes corollae]|uniref:uncharacterized protein LOC129947059 n=1 Tax=Eupeodes corollae TaxID=290404 RepID=UPI0024937EDC|nr:uncharacterized protein LOC129947059 [Eupeodes corollae]